MAWVLVMLAVAAYMLPTIIASQRHKSNTGAIGVLNLLTGWTVIGWFVALVMACSVEQRPAAPPPRLRNDESPRLPGVDEG